MVVIRSLSYNNFVNLFVEIRSTKSCCWFDNGKVELRRKGFSIKLNNKDVCASLYSSRINNNKTGGSKFCNSFSTGDNGNDDNGNGSGSGGGGGENEEGKNDNESGEEPMVPIIMKFEEVIKVIEARGVSLPLDMLEATRADGISKPLLLRYLDLQGTCWPLGFAMRSRPFAWLRNRMLADPGFIVKLTIELAVNMCGITIGQVLTRGKDFWAEFEVHASNLFVVLLAKSALVSLTSPTIPIGRPKGFYGYLLRTYSGLPGKMMDDFGMPDSFDRLYQALGYTLVLHMVVGFACGLIGQGIVANGIRVAVRKMKKSYKDLALRSLLHSTCTWGFNMVDYGVWELVLKLLCEPPKSIAPNLGPALNLGRALAISIYTGAKLADLGVKYQFSHNLR